MAWASIPICILRPGDKATGRLTRRGDYLLALSRESPRHPVSSFTIQLLQFGHRLLVAIEPSFVRAEGSRVVDAAAVDGARAVFHMKHFVVEHEFDHILRDR